METETKNPLIKFWQKPWQNKLIIIVIGLFILFTIRGLFSPQGQKNLEKGYKEGPKTDLDSSPSPSYSSSPSSSTPTASPTVIASPISNPYEIMSQIGKDVAGDNSNVSIFKNDDGSIDIINNIQLTPEITWVLDAATREWVTGFLSKSYTSGLDVRYVLVTVSFLHTGQPATRVGLGVNLAQKYTSEEWQTFTPYDLCRWLKQIQTGENIDPGDPNYDPSDWAFAKNYKCS